MTRELVTRGKIQSNFDPGWLNRPSPCGEDLADGPHAQ
jgi:hypothetical protein